MGARREGGGATNLSAKPRARAELRDPLSTNGMSVGIEIETCIMCLKSLLPNLTYFEPEGDGSVRCSRLCLLKQPPPLHCHLHMVHAYACHPPESTRL